MAQRTMQRKEGALPLLCSSKQPRVTKVLSFGDIAIPDLARGQGQGRGQGPGAGGRRPGRGQRKGGEVGAGSQGVPEARGLAAPGMAHTWLPEAEASSVPPACTRVLSHSPVPVTALVAPHPQDFGTTLFRILLWGCAVIATPSGRVSGSVAAPPCTDSTAARNHATCYTRSASLAYTPLSTTSCLPSPSRGSGALAPAHTLCRPASVAPSPSAPATAEHLRESANRLRALRARSPERKSRESLIYPENSNSGGKSQ